MGGSSRSVAGLGVGRDGVLDLLCEVLHPECIGLGLIHHVVAEGPVGVRLCSSLSDLNACSGDGRRRAGAVQAADKALNEILAPLHSLLAQFYPPYTQMCFYIAFFNTGVTMLVFIVAEPWRQAQGQVFIQTAGYFCFTNNIDAVTIPVAVVIAVQRLPGSIDTFMVTIGILQHIPVSQPGFDCAQLDITAIVFACLLQISHFFIQVGTHFFIMIFQIAWHGFRLCLLLRFQQPFSHIQTAVRSGACRHVFDITHTLQFIDIAVISAVQRYICRYQRRRCRNSRISS